MEEHAITIKLKLKKPLGFFVLCCFFVITAEIVSHFNSAHAAETSGIGPVLDRFNLTLEAGYRTEAAGPFFYSETKDSETVSYTHLRAHETRHDLVCRL